MKKQVIKQPRNIIYTKAGYQELQEKYEKLLSERVVAVEQLKKARDMGDLSENGFYKASKQKLGSIDHQLLLMKHYLRYGVITESNSQNSIQIGAIVTIETHEIKKTISLVGEHEANPSEGKISFRSPLGKGLLNKKIGDIAAIETPRGIINYTIVTIQ